MSESVSYSLEGDEVVEIRSSPAISAADEIEKVKLAGSALVAKKAWEPAIEQYERCISLARTSRETLSVDFEAERKVERCVLACLSNQALCALKLEACARAKAYCATALELHSKARQPDGSYQAKVLFRRGQACLGLSDARAAVESISEAIGIEEGLIGAKSGVATVGASDTVAAKARLAAVVAMKRELLKARKAARDEEKLASANFKGARGFLKSGAKSISDPREERKAAIEKALDDALQGVYAGKTTPGSAAFDGAMASLARVGAESERARDAVSERHAAFGEGFVAFAQSECQRGSAEGRARTLALCADSYARYWALRGSEDDALPLGLSDAVAREGSAHACMALKRYDAAEGHFHEFLKVVEQAGPLQAYHNLPDSFLLSRGMGKMDDRQRRAFKWKHRSHSQRAVFDARTGLAAVAQERGRKSESLLHARLSLEAASDDEEKRTAHANLVFLLRADWSLPPEDDDAAAAAAAAAASPENLAPTPEELAEADQHARAAEELVAKIAQTKLDEAEKHKPATSVDGDDDAPPEIDQDADDDAKDLEEPMLQG